MNHQLRRNSMNSIFLGPLMGLVLAGLADDPVEFWLFIALSFAFLAFWMYLAHMRLHIEQWQYYLNKTKVDDSYNEEFFKAVFW